MSNRVTIFQTASLTGNVQRLTNCAYRESDISRTQSEFIKGIKLLDNVITKSDVQHISLWSKEDFSSTISEAHGHMCTALTTCEDRTRKVDDEIARKVEKITKIQSAIREIQQSYAGLKEELRFLNQEIKSNKIESGKAHDLLNKTRTTLQKQVKELRRIKFRQTVLNTLHRAEVSYLTGKTPLAHVGSSSLDDDLRTARSRSEYVERSLYLYEEKIKLHNTKVGSLKEKVSEKDTDQQRTKRELEYMEAERNQCREELHSLVDTQEKLRNSCRFMSQFCRRTNVLAIGARNFYSWTPLVTLFVEIAELLSAEKTRKLMGRTVIVGVACRTATQMKAINKNFQCDLV